MFVECHKCKTKINLKNVKKVFHCECKHMVVVEEKEYYGVRKGRMIDYIQVPLKNELNNKNGLK